jgi:hypothetical protein
LTSDGARHIQGKKSTGEILSYQAKKKDVCGSYPANMASLRIFITVSAEIERDILYQGTELGSLEETIQQEAYSPH